MRISAATLSRRAHAWMGHLARNGLQPGDVVALEARSDARSVVHLMGLWAFGAVVVPLPLRYPPATWPHWARQAGARWAVSTEPLGLPALPLASEDGMGAIALDCPPATHPGGVRIFTSGSTGSPKVVHLKWTALWHSAVGVNAHLNVSESHTWLLALPLYHVGGLGIVVRTWMREAALAFADDHEMLADTLSRTQPTHLSLVPTQLRRLVHTRPELLPHAKAVFLGGSAVDATLIEEGVRHGIALYTSYGLSEMSSTVTLTPVGASVAALRTSGGLLPGREMKEVQGELFVRGSTLFSGYFVGGEIKPSVTPDGWFPTGDLGHCDLDGMWHILGRKDAMFISGGENIHPETLEYELLSLPGVEEAVVVPVDDLEFGHRPFAFLSGDDLPSLDEVRAHLENRIPRFMHPVGVAQMPAGSGMKPSRTALRAVAQDLR